MVSNFSSVSLILYSIYTVSVFGQYFVVSFLVSFAYCICFWPLRFLSGMLSFWVMSFHHISLLSWWCCVNFPVLLYQLILVIIPSGLSKSFYFFISLILLSLLEPNRCCWISSQNVMLFFISIICSHYMSPAFNNSVNPQNHLLHSIWSCTSFPANVSFLIHFRVDLAVPIIYNVFHHWC